MPTSPLYVDLFYLDSIDDVDSTEIKKSKLKKRVGPDGQTQYVVTTRYKLSIQPRRGQRVHSYAPATGNPG